MAKQSETIVKAVPATVVGALADAFERSISTIVRWISKNDDRLTSDKARKVFSDYDFVWEAEEAAAK